MAELLSTPLADLSEKCAAVWGQREQLDIVLSDGFRNVPHCLFLYVLDTNGIQISDNVSSSGLLPEHYGRDRSRRPYMRETVPSWGFLLSDAYLSLRANRPSLTALQVVRSGNEMLGFLGADFDLRDLPVTAALYEESSDWRQVKGDPAIRGTVFQQCRVDSLMDRNMDPAMAILEELLTERGMFQGVIHFSSSRATIWLMDDPFRYRILDHEALSDPDVCMLYSRRSYPEDALIPPDRIKPLLNGMRQLRLADETLYLRSASINIFNGMISLTFSCDGTHYMSWREFLDKDISFWVGCAA
ncbi:MAG: PDC sensor domain-containing protein [Gammaproteobacteria bacterium]|nr:PDC sensor domain-containing protein [Gammaproteobacteria bacterium]